MIKLKLRYAGKTAFDNRSNFFNYLEELANKGEDIRKVEVTIEEFSLDTPVEQSNQTRLDAYS